MGGGAFADSKNPSASLLTPRMPPAVYTYVRDKSINILRTFYAHVQCPIEAPAKLDYGDIDILVASPLKGQNMTSLNESTRHVPGSESTSDEETIEHSLNSTDAAEIARALGATKTKQTKNSQTTHFALPWPKQQQIPEELQPTTSANTPSTSTGDLFIQLDLHVCPSPLRFEWELFHQSHGDLWNILGGIVRPFGIKVNNVGLHLRIKEITDLGKDASSVFLTASPLETLSFLGLDPTKYAQPFGSAEELYRYAASCRFHDPKRSFDRTDLKANDRQRMRKRKVFAGWLDVYIPAHRDDAAGSAAHATPAAVVEDAKRCFHVGDEYERQLKRGLRALGEAKMWSDIRTSLPIEGQTLGIVMRGAKREVVGEAEGKDFEQLSGPQRAYAQGRFEHVVEWARADWEAIERRQAAYEREKSTRNLLAKIERDSAKVALEE